MEGNWKPPKEGERDKPEPCPDKEHKEYPLRHEESVRDAKFYRETGMVPPPPPAPPIVRAPLPSEEEEVREYGGGPEDFGGTDEESHYMSSKQALEPEDMLSDPEKETGDLLPLKKSVALNQVEDAIGLVFESLPHYRIIQDKPVVEQVQFLLTQLILVSGMIEKRKIEVKDGSND